jgi:hypothetical protein
MADRTGEPVEWPGPELAEKLNQAGTAAPWPPPDLARKLPPERYELGPDGTEIPVPAEP